MNALRTVRFSVLLVLLLGAGSVPAVAQLQHGDSAVTPENLVRNEQFWPYQTSLRESYRPEGAARSLPAGRLGVLIRVRENGFARVDFGRLGRYEVPVAATNLVELANRVRSGEIHKLAPNFTLAIRTRLVALESGALRPVASSSTNSTRVFACLFADPLSEDFPAQVEALRDAYTGETTMTLLVPQGGHGDAAVAERLRAVRWEVPFVSRRFAEAETAAQLGKGRTAPALLVQSDEGRLLEDESLHGSSYD